jgi:endonuclease/exonuclease/phosphatase family metal-dependent hydrolase
MASLRVAVATLTVMLAAVACQGSVMRMQSVIAESRPAPTRTSEYDSEARRTLRLLTFNAGLAVGVLEHATERAPAVVQALAREPLDVLCVQEFWHESHWRSLADALGDRLSQRLRPPPIGSNAGAPCKRREIKRAEACVNQQCAGVPNTELALCAMRSCAKFALDLSSQCMGCLSRDPLRGAAEIFAECVEPEHLPATAAKRQSEPSEQDDDKTPGEASSYYYGGSSGIGLLVGPPIVDAGLLRLESTMHPRAVLYARLGTPDLHVFCTHLTPVLRSVAYSGSGSWETEQSRQIDALLEFIELKAKGGKVILLGDLNTGPELSPRVAGRLPGHYARVIARGFFNPYLESVEPKCSFCYDNPVSSANHAGGILIDHVLTRGLGEQGRVRRLLDDPVDIVVRGRRVTTAYSDHYGMMLELDL